jgi:hypothetical protein
MKVISYQVSFSSRLLKKIYIFSGVVFLLLLLSAVAWLTLHYLGNEISLSFRLLLLVVEYVGLGFFYGLLRSSFIDDLVNNLRGKKGEDLVADILGSHFDGSYTYIRNYVVPGSAIGDIDGLLVGQNEIIIIEVKYFSGEFEIRNGEFYKITEKGQYHLWSNPIKQVKKQKDCLLSFLKERSLCIHVRSFVVLVSGRVRRFQGPTGVYVLNKDNFVDVLNKETSIDHNLTNQPIQRILDSLINSRHSTPLN